MAKNPDDSFYTEPDEFLQQGDIFRVDIVAPVADMRQRILRTMDGRHGSLVFAENLEGRVFSRAELDSFLAGSTITGLRTLPFHPTPDGQEEMVVVCAKLHRFFIVATQTCDICGKDKAPHPWATILPVITVADLCRNENLPWSSTNDVITIHDFVLSNCEDATDLESMSDMDYVPRLKAVLEGSAKSSNDKKVRQDLLQATNYLKTYYKKLYMFSLPADPRLHFPESYVDFTSVFTVPSAKLFDRKVSRIVTIADLYRVSFAQRFGEFFDRLALPRPMHPE